MPIQAELAQILSNVVYLIFVWGIFIAVIPVVAPMSAAQKRAALWAAAAMFVLAFGDSFHLVPRLVEALPRLLGRPVDVGGWLGFGLAASSFTLALFYLFLTLYAWRKFELPRNGWLWLLVAACLVRSASLLFPQNAWGSEAYTPWKFYRNIPFAVQGIGVVLLFWQAARRSMAAEAALLRGMGWSIVVSFVCYTVTLVGVLWSPLWGMFMLPKSAAYVVLVWLLFRFEFGARRRLRTVAKG